MLRPGRVFDPPGPGHSILSRTIVTWAQVLLSSFLLLRNFQLTVTVKVDGMNHTDNVIGNGLNRMSPNFIALLSTTEYGVLTSYSLLGHATTQAANGATSPHLEGFSSLCEHHLHQLYLYHVPISPEPSCKLPHI